MHPFSEDRKVEIIKSHEGKASELFRFELVDRQGKG